MIQTIVIGASFGGMEAITYILSNLPEKFRIPIVVVLHIGSNNINNYLSALGNSTHFKVKEAEEKETIHKGVVYFAPPNYHLLLENNRTMSLSTDKKVNFSRPSIDVLFETAAWAYKKELLGILLSGSNADGAEGLKIIKEYGGVTLVQNPETSVAGTMPGSALHLFKPDFVLDLQDIAKKIEALCS